MDFCTSQTEQSSSLNTSGVTHSWDTATGPKHMHASRRQASAAVGRLMGLGCTMADSSACKGVDTLGARAGTCSTQVWQPCHEAITQGVSR